MVATQQGDMGWQSELPASQECQRLQAPCTSVHKVPCSHQCLLKRTARRSRTSLNPLDSDLTCLRCREMTQLRDQQPYENKHMSALVDQLARKRLSSRKGEILRAPAHLIYAIEACQKLHAKCNDINTITASTKADSASLWYVACILGEPTTTSHLHDSKTSSEQRESLIPIVTELAKRPQGHVWFLCRVQVLGFSGTAGT